MGKETFSVDSYRAARETYHVTHDVGVTRVAEQRVKETNKLSEKVDPAVNPMRYSKIRLNPHGDRWIVTVGCPMDIEISCDTTGSMGNNVDKEMKVLPDLYNCVKKIAPGYDYQLCLGIFGDLVDKIAMCRPQFEMTADKIVDYLKDMAPQRCGGDGPEDPQYAMFARAYLTNAYTNNIGLKGYHIIVTDATCHNRITESGIRRIFGDDIFKNELSNMDHVPSVKEVIKKLKEVTHQFVLVVYDEDCSQVVDFWNDLCGEHSVIRIDSTEQLPKVVASIVGLTEGTLEIGSLRDYLGSPCRYGGIDLVKEMSKVEIDAQIKLRRALPYPLPKVGDIFQSKADLWPIQPNEDGVLPIASMLPIAPAPEDKIEYL